MAPLVKQLPTYVKDSSYVLQILGVILFMHSHQYLFTMDIWSLYIVIPNTASWKRKAVHKNEVAHVCLGTEWFPVLHNSPCHAARKQSTYWHPLFMLHSCFCLFNPLSVLFNWCRSFSASIWPFCLWRRFNNFRNTSHLNLDWPSHLNCSTFPHYPPLCMKPSSFTPSPTSSPVQEHSSSTASPTSPNWPFQNSAVNWSRFQILTNS